MAPNATQKVDDADLSMFKLPATPSMALFALSPEKVNQRGPPQSPSLPNIIDGKSYFTPSRSDCENEPSSPTSSSKQGSITLEGRPQFRTTSSEVHSMVARFNSLDIKDHAEMRRRDAAALKRAQMGREEAENALAKAREENRRLKEELTEGKDRESKVAKRLEAVMEDFGCAKEAHQRDKGVYEKEIRRAKKEAFKQGSMVVKVQEELKATRATCKVAQADLEMEKMKSSRRDQEAFTAQYDLVGVQQKLVEAESRIKVVEEERDALKMNLKEEEVARIAAEGRIALPLGRDDDTSEFASPQKKSHTPMVDNVENARVTMEMQDLRDEIVREQMAREHAEELVDFMRMECHFGCCSCRLAERRQPTTRRPSRRSLRPATPPVEHPLEIMEVDPLPPYSNPAPEEHYILQPKDMIPSPEDPPATEEAVRNTTERQAACVETVDAPAEGYHQDDQMQDTVDEVGMSAEAQVMHFADQETQEPERPATPDDSHYRTVTRTTTVPLAPSTPAAANTSGFGQFNTPGMMSISREEAMEQIRQRRGRARSIAGTPKRNASQSQATPRRDISAPEHRKKVNGKTPARN